MNKQEAKVVCSIVTWSIPKLNPKILIVGNHVSELKVLLQREFENKDIKSAEDIANSRLAFDIIVYEERKMLFADIITLLKGLNNGGMLLAKSDDYSWKGNLESDNKNFCVFEFCDSKAMPENNILIIYKPFPGKEVMPNHSFLQAASYDSYVSNYKEDVDFIGKWLGNAKSVLEIGIGTGRLALKFCGTRDNYCGIDASASMIHILQNKIKNKNIKLNVFHQNMQMVSLEEKFDAIILPFRVLPYLSNESEILNTLIKLKQLLNLNGRILLNMIDFDDEYIKEWNNKEYYESFKSPFDTNWIKKDIMSFDIGKKILMRKIQILCEDNVICQTQDNLKWLSSKKLEELCNKAGLTVENVWPAYSFRAYNDEWEYLICARLLEI